MNKNQIETLKRVNEKSGYKGTTPYITEADNQDLREQLAKKDREILELNKTISRVKIVAEDEKHKAVEKIKSKLGRKLQKKYEQLKVAKKFEGYGIAVEENVFSLLLLFLFLFENPTFDYEIFREALINYLCSQPKHQFSLEYVSYEDVHFSLLDTMDLAWEIFFTNNKYSALIF